MNPRVLEPQCEWTAGRRRRRDALDRALRRRRAGRARRLAAPRAGSGPTTCSRSTQGRLPAADARRAARAHRARADRRARLRPPARHRPLGATARPRWRSSTGASARTSACRGRRTSTATCSATSPIRTSAIDDPTARGNELGGVALPFHCDGSDLVGLLCLENGRAGGLSAVANSVRDPQPARARAARPRRRAVRGAPVRLPRRAGRGRQAVLLDAGVHRVGRPAVRALHPALHLGLAAPPGRAAAHRAAAARRCTRVVAMADDPANHVLMELRPGDMQFINNYHVLHGRTAYEDDRGSGPHPPPEAAVARDHRAREPPAVLREPPQPLGGEALGQPDACRGELIGRARPADGGRATVVTSVDAKIRHLASDLSPAWLSDVLGADVADVEILDHAFATNQRVRIGLSYTSAGAGPASLFVKLAPLDPAHRAMIGASGMGEREAEFYNDVAPTVNLRVPRSLFRGDRRRRELRAAARGSLGGGVRVLGWRVGRVIRRRGTRAGGARRVPRALLRRGRAQGGRAVAGRAVGTALERRGPADAPRARRARQRGVARLRGGR